MGEAAEYQLSDQRRAMIELLQEQSAGLTPKAVSDLSNREYNAVKKLLWTMGRDGQLQVDNKGRYSVPSNTGNLGNCRVNAEDHGNPNGASDGTSTVIQETMEFQAKNSPSYPVTTVTDILIDGGEDIIAAERWAIEHEDSIVES